MKKYKEYMDGVKVSDTLHRRLAELDASKRSPLPRLVRTGLIAACLCLVLFGTTYAVTLIIGNFRTVEFYNLYWPEVYPGFDGIAQPLHGYQFWGGALEFLPVESFSEEARAEAKKQGADTTGRYYDDWVAAADYFNVDLRENPVIDEFPPVRCYATLYSSAEGITYVQFEELYKNLDGLRGLNLSIVANVYSELMYSPKREMWFGYGYTLDYTYTTEEYRSGNITAFISHAEYVAGREHAPQSADFGDECYRAHMILDGAVYEIVVTFPRGESERGYDLLERILSGYDR